MKTISLRKFNSDVAILSEPVIITVRKGGEYRILGEFHPAKKKPAKQAPEVTE